MCNYYVQPEKLITGLLPEPANCRMNETENKKRRERVKVCMSMKNVLNVSTVAQVNCDMNVGVV